jgi:hypothetical protein
VLEEIGSDAYVFFHADAPKITSEVLEASDDDTLLLDATALFTARIDPRTRARAGDTLRLALDPSRLHFFDAQTGARLLEAGGTTAGRRRRAGDCGSLMQVVHAGQGFSPGTLRRAGSGGIDQLAHAGRPGSPRAAANTRSYTRRR